MKLITVYTTQKAIFKKQDSKIFSEKQKTTTNHDSLKRNSAKLHNLKINVLYDKNENTVK